MEVNVKIFGQLADITGSAMVAIKDVGDTDSLIVKMTVLFPLLSGSRFAIAVDKKVVNRNTALNIDSEVALLPPFSGG